MLEFDFRKGGLIVEKPIIEAKPKILVTTWNLLVFY